MCVIQDVISHVINHLSYEEKSEHNLYSLLAVCQASNIKHWLHRDMTVSESHKELCSIHSAPEEWRLDLHLFSLAIASSKLRILLTAT